MKSGKEIGEELKEMYQAVYGEKAEISNLFAGGNAGLAIAGYAIADAIREGLQDIAIALRRKKGSIYSGKKIEKEKEKECEHFWVRKKSFDGFYHQCDKCGEEKSEDEST